MPDTSVLWTQADQDALDYENKVRATRGEPPLTKEEYLYANMTGGDKREPYTLPPGAPESYVDPETGKIMRWFPGKGFYLPGEQVMATDKDQERANRPNREREERERLDWQIKNQKAQLELQWAQEDRQRESEQWSRQYQQAQLEEQRNQRLAQLAANPKSWIEYATYAGQTPAIQPWMIPLMPGRTNRSVGKAIPGFGPRSIPADQDALTPEENLQNRKEWWTEGPGAEKPELLNPSAQYLARLAPAMKEQYYGYQQAVTGERPEDTSWRLWGYAPPSGSNRPMRMK